MKNISMGNVVTSVGSPVLLVMSIARLAVRSLQPRLSPGHALIDLMFQV